MVVYPKQNMKGCRDFKEFKIPFETKAGAGPTFILVDQGGMESLKKV